MLIPLPNGMRLTPIYVSIQRCHMLSKPMKAGFCYNVRCCTPSKKIESVTMRPDVARVLQLRAS